MRHNVEDVEQVLALIAASEAKAVYGASLSIELHRAAKRLWVDGLLGAERFPGTAHLYYPILPESHGWFLAPGSGNNTQHYSTGKGFLCGRRRFAGRPLIDHESRGDFDYCCTKCLAIRREQFAAIIIPPTA